MGIMDLLWNPDKGKRPRRKMVYGIPGIGKTTFAMDYPKTCLIPFDDGYQDLSNIEGRVLPMCRTLDDFRRMITLLSEEDHPFGGVVIDGVGRVDDLVCASIAAEHGKPTVGDIGYGKGGDLVTAKWHKILDSLEDLQLKRNVAIFFIAHSHVVKKKDPLTDPYDQYQPNLSKEGTTAVAGWCDEVYFITTKVWTMEKDAGFGATRTKATGGEMRVMYTEERPGYLAKNRLGLPAEIPLGTRDNPQAWATIKQFMKPPPPIKGPHSREPGDESESTTTFPN